jgi:hypothetical protein
MTLHEAAREVLDTCTDAIAGWNSLAPLSVRQAALQSLDALRAALDQSPVKTYCGGKPNYVIPQTFSEWWDSDEMAHFNPYEEDTPAYWAYEGWMARGR